MSTETASQTTLQNFECDPAASLGDCSCPIHRTERQPFTAPLGLSFSDSVHVESIPQSKAASIYEHHHGYMGADLHPSNFDHHGLFYQSQLLGAITYRYPRFSLKKLYLDENGELLPQPYSENDFEDLPGQIREQAKDLVGGVQPEDVAETKVLEGDEFVEANRICIGERMANLASCSLAKSQETFVQSQASPEFKYFVTYVMSEYSASMIRALKDKGWTCVGWSPPSSSSNREEKEIQKKFKWCFLCPVSDVISSESLNHWSTNPAEA
jgi:hypothetical protein